MKYTIKFFKTTLYKKRHKKSTEAEMGPLNIDFEQKVHIIENDIKKVPEQK